MTVSITCPWCKTPHAIQAEVNHNDTSDVIDYPEACPVCNHAIGNDEIAEIQGQALQDIHDSMIEAIYERQKDREIAQMIRRHI